MLIHSDGYIKGMMNDEKVDETKYLRREKIDQRIFFANLGK